MVKKSTVIAALIALMGCGEEKTGATPNHDDSNTKTKDASVRRDASHEDAASSTDSDRDAGSDEPADRDADGIPAPIDDAGSIEITGADGGKITITPGEDGGAQLMGSGSCCQEHDTPGCSNADLMVCVCELDPSCCTDKWKASCVLTVTTRMCQPAVRACVCGDNGFKPDCCTSADGTHVGNWTSTCDTVGKLKCDQIPGCF
jgi:hypothetical protein